MIERRSSHSFLGVTRITRQASLALGLMFLIVLAPILFWHAQAISAELVMFEAADCPWCARWDAEVGIVYAKTDEGRELPLRRVDIDEARPAHLALIKPITYSPTFVLVDEGREIGRVTGYPGEDHFWGLLGILVRKWKADEAKN